MKYLSVCSGIEAATVAWHHMGWTPVGFSEIEKFPGQVLDHHYPEVPKLGDMTKYKEWNIEHPDIIVGGTPCQSFSVAGLRKGLDDPRGNLALVYCGMLDYFRPRWFVWENVPGVLSSNGGRDFGSFLGALAQLGYGFAYRVLDAQWFGVAQRRRRVFVVGYLGDWRPAAAVLFERESLRRDSLPSREAREKIASFTPTSIGGHGEGRGALRANGGDIGGGSETLVAKCLTRGIAQRFDSESETMTPVGVPEVMATLLSSTAGISRPGNAVTEHETYIPMAPIPYDLHQVTAPVNRQARKPGDPCHTLAKQNAHNAGIVCTQGNLIGREADDAHRVVQLMGIDYEYNAHDLDGPTGSLLKGSPTGGGHPLPAVMQPIPFDTTTYSTPAIGNIKQDNVASCISRNTGGGGETQNPAFVVQPIAFHATQKVAQPMCFQQNTRDEVRYIGGDGQIAGALSAQAGMKQQNYVAQPIAFHATQDPISGSVSPALGSNMYAGVAHPIACDTYNGTIQGDVCTTLTADMAGPTHSGPKVMQPIGALCARTGQSISVQDAAQGHLVVDGTPTMRCGSNYSAHLAVAQPIAVDVYNQTIDGDTAATLTQACGGTNTSGPKVMQPIEPIRYGEHQQDTLHHESGILSTLPAGSKNNTSHYTNTVVGMAVRRLTPVECERLQGFPDNYTDIRPNGKDTADGPRYKALGNSMAVPVMRWIGERIKAFEDR